MRFHCYPKYTAGRKARAFPGEKGVFCALWQRRAGWEAIVQ